jgi:hypothetical protein
LPLLYAGLLLAAGCCILQGWACCKACWQVMPNDDRRPQLCGLVLSHFAVVVHLVCLNHHQVCYLNMQQQSKSKVSKLMVFVKATYIDDATCT